MTLRKKILLNTLIILSITMIYMLLFPKKSYIQKKIDNKFNNPDITQNEIKTENENNKLLCIYEYIKNESEYSDWSNWSEWQLDEITENENIKVETKIEKQPYQEITEKITSDIILKKEITCPNGYINENNNCKKKIAKTQIKASIKYTCPNGYNKKNDKCYKESNVISAQKKYYCPSNTNYEEFEINDDMCILYMITYINPLKTSEIKTCKAGYNIENNKCVQYKKIKVGGEERTYYRYQKREIIEKKHIKWSNLNDQNLLDLSYKLNKEITCNF